jgi:hypothetical protein
MNPDGTGSWIGASRIGGGPALNAVATNAAPALSNDEGTVYAVVVSSSSGNAALAALDSTTLKPKARVALKDPKSGFDAAVAGSATPMVGPDGDVYFGVLENPYPENNDRGWMLHFSADLTQKKTPGAFGWDNTAAVVPRALVPSYTGTSAYLLMTKYNNYAGVGTGDGVNKIAVLDPDATMTDPITGVTIMNEVLTIKGVTPDDYWVSHGYPNAVREWCINAAAVDPFTKSVMANSEDGSLYRWDLSTNTFTQTVKLTAGVGEAYTPTAIGADGTVYAINRGVLFAVGTASNQPGTGEQPTELSAVAGTALPLPTPAARTPTVAAPDGAGTIRTLAQQPGVASGAGRVASTLRRASRSSRPAPKSADALPLDLLTELNAGWRGSAEPL